MPISRGLVDSIHAREDGWVEVRILAAHATNTVRKLLIPSVDGDLTQANRRIAMLSLLRDALARTLPVEVVYSAEGKEGDQVTDVTVYPTTSTTGRRGSRWELVRVIGCAVRQRGPEVDASPYVEEADLALVTVLRDDASIALWTLDLQRAHPGTGRALLTMIEHARSSARLIELHLHEAIAGQTEKRSGKSERESATAAWIVGAAWPAIEPAELVEVVAFLERIGQRADVLDVDKPVGSELVWVKYTTAPDQVPEGDVSENGSFAPTSGVATVHPDSPLYGLLVGALRDRLQVKLGLLDDSIRSVEVVSHLGSAARPVWVDLHTGAVCDDTAERCDNTPTIAMPGTTTLGAIPHTVRWRGYGYFNEGLWRIAVSAGTAVTVSIDGKAAGCPERSATAALPEKDGELYRSSVASLRDRASTTLVHVYLDGMHELEITLRGWTCGSPFQAQVFRIR